jgi:hypothetical protein
LSDGAASARGRAGTAAATPKPRAIAKVSRRETIG